MINQNIQERFYLKNLQSKYVLNTMDFKTEALLDIKLSADSNICPMFQFFSSLNIFLSINDLFVNSENSDVGTG